tara:strand:+ start:360 stop:824 length:465 start_codon:yes stop_codon:yes gene_type:complete
MRITPARLRAFGLTSPLAALSTTLLACGATQPVQLSCQAQFIDIKDDSSADYNFVLDLDPAKMQGQFVPVSQAAKQLGDQDAEVNKLALQVESDFLQVIRKTDWDERLVFAFDRNTYELKSYENQRKKLSKGWILAEPGVTDLTCTSFKAADPR